jgi:phosphatidylglycerophosphatase C
VSDQRDVSVVAAFDVDGTLTVRDCVVPFLVRLGGRRGIVTAMLRRPFATLGAAVRRDRDAMKEVVVGGVLRGRSVTAVNAEGQRFADHVERHWLRVDVIDRLRWHQAQGHVTVVVSASLVNYLQPLAHALGIDAVLATSGAAVDDRFTDRLDGENCRAGVKRRRLETWLAEQQMTTASLWAYGDSKGDREMLAAAHVPQWVKDVVVVADPGSVA